MKYFNRRASHWLSSTRRFSKFRVGLSPLGSCVGSILNADSYVKESVSAPLKIVGFLRVLRFPPTGNVDSVCVAVLRDQTWVPRWLLEASMESLGLDQIELSPFAIQFCLQLRVRMIRTHPLYTGERRMLCNIYTYTYIYKTLFKPR
jgi:hypothetical protein